MDRIYDIPTKSLKKDLEEIQEELERRAKAKEKRPQPKENIDWSPIVSFVEDTVEEVVTGKYHEDNDDGHGLWEEVMTTVYGKDFFDWWDKNAYS